MSGIENAIKILLLLVKWRGKLISAAFLAHECVCSRRTVKRIIDALCVAGVPITSHSGPKGCYGIMDVEFYDSIVKKLEVKPK